VAAFYYDLPRPTNDLDYIEVVPDEATVTLEEIAGIASPLARRHGLHFQHVGVRAYRNRMPNASECSCPGRLTA
jgi:hypothetical protein